MKMRILLLLAICLFCSSSLSAQSTTPSFPNLYGETLVDALRREFKPNTVLSYAEVRDRMYAQFDNVNDTVQCVYSGHRLYLDPIADPSQYLYLDGDANGINCEHLWPRSKGAREGNAVSDAHHLFPTRVAVNAARGNDPFGEIDDQRTERWFYLDQERPQRPYILTDAYSEKIPGRFEPREDFKGNAARALFYFYTMYRDEALAADPNFFEAQRATLCQWNRADPVDRRELQRTREIARYQDGKVNPFIVDPTLAERCYCQ